MGCEADALELLRGAGHKLTPQRMLVLRSVRHASGHITAAEILDEVRASYPYVDISTVYRTLAVLKDMRLVTETHMGGADAMFEWVPNERHHHLVCRKCHQIVEMDHHYLNDLSVKLAADVGFQAEIDHFAIFGLCRSCSAAGGEERP